MNKIQIFISILLVPVFSYAQVFDAEVLKNETSIIVNNERLTKKEYYEIRINNRAGEKYTKIMLPYSRLTKISNIEACIKDRSGKIVNKLTNSQITSRSAYSENSFYEDEMIKEFTLKHSSYPYTIIYSYQVQESEFIYLDVWSPVKDMEIPTIEATLRVTVPVTYKISFSNHLIGEPKIDTLENTINYAWQTSYSNIVKPETSAPLLSGFLPLVTITPNDFNFEMRGSFKDWISYGNWHYEIIKNLNVLPESEKIKVQSLIKDIDDDKEKIKILYHYLQDETRYINISIETGGLKPYPASYVAQNKYGDCKALTNYFKSILELIGINSYYSKIYAGSPDKEIDKDFPSQQFNHIILYVPLKGEKIWLDCTSDGAFNYLGTFTQNREAFIIDSANSHFIRTPALSKDDVLKSCKIEIAYKPEYSDLKSTNTYRGELYENFLQLDKNYNESEKSRIVRNYIIDDNFQLTDYKITGSDRDSDRIEFTYNAISHSIYKNCGNEILVSNIAFSVPKFEKPSDRKLPVQIDYPIYMIDTLIYEIPPGYKLIHSTLNDSVNDRFGEYKFEMHTESDKIIVIKSLLINSGYYQVSEYANFYSFYKKIWENENKIQISFHNQESNHE
jgi:hypothetical protein